MIRGNKIQNTYVIQNSFSELFGGLYSGSLAILTDAAHLLTDMSSFIISLVAIHLSERPGMSTACQKNRPQSQIDIFKIQYYFFSKSCSNIWLA